MYDEGRIGIGMMGSWASRVGVGWVLSAALVAAGTACTDTSAGVGEPLTLRLTVDRTAGLAAVDTFTFQYEATGTDLLGVTLEFGDGQVDSLSTLGASSAAATRSHVYAAAGRYSAIARVIEALSSTLSDTVVVEVQGGS
jgi:hypothetical protein